MCILVDGDWCMWIVLDGCEFIVLMEGEFDDVFLNVIVEYLVVYIMMLDVGVVVFWEGFGGFVGFYGEMFFCVFFMFIDDLNY